MKRPSAIPVMLWLSAIVLLLLPAGGLAIGVAPGPRQAIIAHEAHNDPSSFGALEVALRDGPAKDYFKGRLLILDNDDPAISKFGPFDDAKPELLVISPPDKLLSRQPVPATADEVVAAFKAKGG